MSFPGLAPTKSGQVLSFGGTSNLDFALFGKFNLILDGSATTAVVNFIDGTETLQFTPTRLLCFKVGGDAAEYPVGASAIDNQKFTVTLNAAGSGAETIDVCVLIAR